MLTNTATIQAPNQGNVGPPQHPLYLCYAGVQPWRVWVGVQDLHYTGRQQDVQGASQWVPSVHGVIITSGLELDEGFFMMNTCMRKWADKAVYCLTHCVTGQLFFSTSLHCFLFSPKYYFLLLSQGWRRWVGVGDVISKTQKLNDNKVKRDTELILFLHTF